MTVKVLDIFTIGGGSLCCLWLCFIAGDVLGFICCCGFEVGSQMVAHLTIFLGTRTPALVYTSGIRHSGGF